MAADVSERAVGVAGEDFTTIAAEDLQRFRCFVEVHGFSTVSVLERKAAVWLQRERERELRERGERRVLVLEEKRCLRVQTPGSDFVEYL